MNNGGPAFPDIETAHIGSDSTEWRTELRHIPGMSLRDYFAAKAMHAELNTAGMLAGPALALAKAADKAGRTVEAQIAFNAYELADAMIAARTNSTTRE